MNMLNELFRGDFMPHGHCFLWRADLLVMHVGGDVATAAAYFAIPAALMKLVRERKDLEFNWIFIMFALFIFFCGITHMLDALNIWHGFYHLEGAAKLATAIVSLITAVLIWRLIPTALAMPSRGELLAKNSELLALQMELSSINQALEARVEERTRELSELASQDPLTGLANRRVLMRTLEHELARAQRHRRHLSVLMLDVDDFKRLNDEHGHHIGDLVLVGVADTFRRVCRSTDTAGRYGGEEFVIICMESTQQQASDLAERLLTAIRTQQIQNDGRSISITCSIGVAEATRSDTADDLLKRTDMAMYQAKSSGKDRVVRAPQDIAD